MVERLYGKQVKKRAELERKLKEAKEREEQQIKETAHPQLSEGTQLLTADRKQTPTFEELYKAAKALQQKKAAQEQKHQEELYAKERQEAPFEPDLVHKSHDK